MRLFDGGRVPNARRVRIFLAEKGISVPMHSVDLGRKEHQTPEFLLMNPLGAVPVLELDDGTFLTESVAICRYFEALHPAPALFGRSALEQARIEEWARRLELKLYIPVQDAFRHTHPAMASYEVPQVPEWGEVSRHRALAMMSLLNEHLADREFVASDTISMADITGFIALEFVKPAKIVIPESLTHLRRWHVAIGARPSAAA